MSSLNYVLGDLTYPIDKEKSILIHVCNNQGGWGAGFVVSLSRRWREPEESYRDWFNSQKKFSAWRSAVC